MENPPALHNLVQVYELTCMSKMQLFFKYNGKSERCKLLIGPEKHTVSDKLFFTSNFLVQKKTIIMKISLDLYQLIVEQQKFDKT